MGTTSTSEGSGITSSGGGSGPTGSSVGAGVATWILTSASTWVLIGLGVAQKVLWILARFGISSSLGISD